MPYDLHDRLRRRRPDGPLYDTAAVAERVAAARVAAKDRGVDLFVNAHTDVFLLGVGQEDGWLADVIARGNAYREAGADGLFVPGLLDFDALGTIARGAGLKVNAMWLPGAPSLEQLREAGVSQYSAGTAMVQVAYTSAVDAAHAFLAGRTRPWPPPSTGFLVSTQPVLGAERGQSGTQDPLGGVGAVDADLHGRGGGVEGGAALFRRAADGRRGSGRAVASPCADRPWGSGRRWSDRPRTADQASYRPVRARPRAPAAGPHVRCWSKDGTSRSGQPSGRAGTVTPGLAGVSPVRAVGCSLARVPYCSGSSSPGLGSRRSRRRPSSSWRRWKG
ncbi:isocitrate lyase/phosphoenolpyruvate mutase family protein [Nonomuraea sp. NPDC004297]